MTPTADHSATLRKLIAIRQETLAVLRQDAQRLGKMRDEAERKSAAARDAQTTFVEEARRAEAGRSTLFADQMQSRRRYLGHLEEQAVEARRVADEIGEQHDKARNALEACHKEIRVLEKLVERRELAAQQESDRRGYRQADDMELIRRLGGRRTHDFVG